MGDDDDFRNAQAKLAPEQHCPSMSERKQLECGCIIISRACLPTTHWHSGRCVGATGIDTKLHRSRLAKNRAAELQKA